MARHHASTRRDFLKVTVGGGAIVAASRPHVARAQGRGEVVVVSWGGAYSKAQREAYFQPFERETGIKVVERTEAFPDLGKIKAQVETRNVEWDLVDVEEAAVWLGMKTDLLELLDFQVIDKRDFPGHAATDHAILSDTWASILAFNTRKYPRGKHPEGWADFWNVAKFPGARALQKKARHTMEMALMADGVPKDKLYPVDVDRALRSLDRIKSSVNVWWVPGAQPAQLLTAGEVDLTSAYSGRIHTIRADGAAADFAWEGALTASDWWVIPKGARNKANAMRLIAFASQPAPQAEFAKRIPYGPGNRKAYDLLSADVLKHLPTSRENERLVVRTDMKFWADNEPAIQPRFDAWLLR